MSNYLVSLTDSEKTANSSQVVFSKIIKSIENGEYLIPDFQRDYVWTLEKCRNLLTSILNGSVIGGILIWNTSLKVQISSMINDVPLKYKETNYYILDGQQRVTSIYHALKGGVFKGLDFSRIKVNVYATTLDEVFVVSKEEKNYLVPLSELTDMNLLHKRGVDFSLFESLLKLKNKITGYLVTMFEFKSDNLEDAIYQFNALNSGGKNMTKEDIVLSKVYSDTFKLKNKVAELKKEVESFCLDEFSILSSLSICLKDSLKSKDFLSLEYDEVVNNWDKFTRNIKITCDFIESIGFNTNSLPYKNCFFAINKIIYDKELTSLTKEESHLFKKYIIISGITNRYTSRSGQQTHTDVILLKKMMDTNSTDFGDIKVSEEDIILNGKNFSKTKINAFRKIINWAMIQKSPISLINNNPINITGKAHSNKNVKNLHHIYPKNFMKNNPSLYEVDHIVNICFIEADVNQRIISDKAPSVYFKELAVSNSDIDKACETHLIDYNIAVADNYDLFFKDRLTKIKDLINSYL